MRHLAGGCLQADCDLWGPNPEPLGMWSYTPALTLSIVLTIRLFQSPDLYHVP